MKLPSPAVLKAAITSLRSLADILQSILAEPTDMLLDVEAVKKPKKGSGKADNNQVRIFCAESGLPQLDADFMFHKFESDGWPKNWQAKIRSWKAAGYLPSQKKQTQPQQQRPKVTV